MSLLASGRLALSVLALCALTACGGGGDSGSSTTQSLPEGGKVVVSVGAITAKDGELVVIDAGTSTLPAKAYTLDTTYGASYATFGDLPVSGRVVKIEPENIEFDTGLAFVEGKPAKFIVGFSAQVADEALGTKKGFACRSSAWTDAELLELKATSLSICSKAITIDETKRVAVYTNLSLPAEESEGKALVISATFSWPVPVSRFLLNGSSVVPGSGGGSISVVGPIVSAPPPPLEAAVPTGVIAITAKEGELIVIDAGASTLPAKTYTLKRAFGINEAVYDDTPLGRLVTVSPQHNDFDTNLSFLQGAPGKFVVFFNAQVAGAALGTYNVFACRSNAWTAEELSVGTLARLPICGKGITIDEINRRVAYANISLPALESGGKAVVISATFSWPVPVQGSFLDGPDGGSVSANPDPAASPSISISTSPAPAASPSISTSVSPPPEDPTVQLVPAIVG